MTELRLPRQGRNHGIAGSDPVPPGRWIYVGTYPADADTTADSPPFQNGVTNAGGGQQRLRFRRINENSLEVDGAIAIPTGSTLPLTVTTMPDPIYIPSEDIPAPGVGFNWLLKSTGDLQVISTLTGGSSPASSSVQFNQTGQTGDFLDIATTDFSPDTGVGMSVVVADGIKFTSADTFEVMYDSDFKVFRTGPVQILHFSPSGVVTIASGAQNINLSGTALNLTFSSDTNLDINGDFNGIMNAGSQVNWFMNNNGFIIDDTDSRFALETGGTFKVTGQTSTAIFSVKEGVGAIHTKPPASSASTLALGTAYQNTLGYDVLLCVVLNITVNTSGVISLGVGPTSTPTQQTLSTGVTSTGFLTVPIYLPDQYYALLSTTGTITLTIAGQNAMPI